MKSLQEYVAIATDEGSEIDCTAILTLAEHDARVVVGNCQEDWDEKTVYLNLISEIFNTRRVFKATVRTVGAAFIALGTVATTPAQAAIIEFSFTTQSGGTGHFTLNTNSASNSVSTGISYLNSEPVLLFNRDGAMTTGISYLNAVSDFSFSSPYINLSNLTADYTVFPSIPFGPLTNRGVLSFVTYPSGCLASTDFTCPVGIPVVYTGNVLELPVLSPLPLSYPRSFGFERFDSSRGELVSIDRITTFQSVPESNCDLGILMFGIASAGLLLKRKMNIDILSTAQPRHSEVKQQLQA